MSEPIPYPVGGKTLGRRVRRTGVRRASSAETAARAIAARANPKRRAITRINPVYVTDGIELPRRKRRVLLDLAPATVDRLYEAIRRDFGYRLGIGEDPPRDIEALLLKARELLR